MAFNVTAEAYERFMGRYSALLAVELVVLAGAERGQRALDVGAGPGALTAELVRRLGAEAVAAVDPSASFVTALGSRFPAVDVRSAVAEQLPFDDASFDLALAQLVVHFMTDPVAGLKEMARVTKPAGRVLACVWNHQPGGGGPLATFWQAVHDTDPDAGDESHLAGTGEGDLADLFAAAGLRQIESSVLTATVRFATFEEWWEPFTLEVGPAGAYVARLDEPGRARLRARCAELLPAGPFQIDAKAWCAQARV